MPPSTVLSVQVLSAALRKVVETTYPDPLWVRGEVSNLSRSANGHVYFTLKEGEAAIACTLWSYRARRLQLPRNGDAIEVLATLSIYEARSQYQLDVQAIRPAGQGAWYQRFLAVKAKLEAEGLFDPARKRPLPRYPRRIAVVTSPQADALQDLLKTLAARAPMVTCVLFPAFVQGSEAPASLVAALTQVARFAKALRLEAVAVIRGGGSAEDLAAFNEEAVARAIAAQPIPVVTGIGHETDTTIADFVADVRAHTPTGAAEELAKGWSAAKEQLTQLENRLRRAFGHQWQRDQQRFDQLTRDLLRASPRRQIREHHQQLAFALSRLTASTRQRLAAAERQVHLLAVHLKHPRQRLREYEQALAALSERLPRAERLLAPRQAALEGIARRLPHPLQLLAPFERQFAERHERLQRARPTLAPARERLARWEAQLHALSPLAVLARGYALVHHPNGRVVARAVDLTAPQPVVIRFADGSAAAEIVSVARSE